MAGAGDCSGYARGVGSARFARSAADEQAGRAPLASLAPPLPRCRWVFLRTPKTKKMLLDVDRVDSQSNSQTSILGSRAVYLLTSVTRICRHGMIVVPSNRYEILPSNGICDD